MSRQYSQIHSIIAVVMLILANQPAHAKTTAFKGTIQTKLDFNRTYTIEIPIPLKTLVLSVPMPQPGSIFGYSESGGQPSISGNYPAVNESDITDTFGNNLHVLNFENLPAGELKVQVNIAGMGIAADLSGELPADPFPTNAAQGDAAAYLLPTEHAQSNDEAIQELSQKITTGAKDQASAALAISRWMVQNVTYDTAGVATRTPATTVLATKKSRCDGFANLYIALARASGIPARSVGGYWIKPGIAYFGKTPAPQQVAVDHTHSWIELWFPTVGWVPYEPQQSAGFADSHHLRAWQTPDSGMTIKTVNFTADVQERPNVTILLTEDFLNVADTVNLTPAGTSDPDITQALYIRKVAGMKDTIAK